MVQNEFQAEHFAREDGGDDEMFYGVARLVKHIDEAASAALADYYARALPSGSDILDLMSSYASHLPPVPAFGRVVGLDGRVEITGAAAEPRLAAPAPREQ